MCGIAGSSGADRGVLEAMGAALDHRGPDGRGLWMDDAPGPGFAHTRLAVIDRSDGGAQPMVSLSGRFVLAYNGEIYNYRELRAELEAEGQGFRSGSDTEVLLALLARHGIDALDRLVGMFAFALWDRRQGELVLVRDRLGIKPLVYAPLPGGGIAFASEIRALKAHPGVGLETDAEALSAFLACLYVPAPRTIHAGIRKLEPGHVLSWRDGVTRIRPYWRPAFTGRRTMALDEAVEEILPVLRRAVVGRMVADVDIGCFLSGGIDSSVIAALMAEEARRTGAPKVRTFTMTFEEAAFDERAAARDVADHIDSDHTELEATPRLADGLEAGLAAFGEPFGNPTSLLVDELSRQARRKVTVALAGDGGDEVFAGYPRYRGGSLAGPYRRLPGWLREAVITPLVGGLAESTEGGHWRRRARQFVAAAGLPDAEMYASWVEYFTPAERAELLGLDAAPARPIAELYAQSPSDHRLDAMQRTDLLSFLPGNLLAYGDAMSMRHSLELRLPLIDHRLVETVGGLAPGVRGGGGMKTLLRAVARRLLPANIVGRRKRGFNPPLGVWLRTDLAARVEARLTRRRMQAVGLHWPAVERLLAEHRGGRRDVALKVWALVVLDAWNETR